MFFTSDLIAKVQKILKTAERKNLKITCAESCTGGLLSALFTEVAGSSKVFERGFITYSNQAKTDLLQVSENLLAKHGAVSPETAAAMAKGATKNSQAQIAIAITGIAGPDGASKEKPIGLVYIATYNKNSDQAIVRKFNFSGDRSEVRKSAVAAALEMVEGVLEK